MLKRLFAKKRKKSSLFIAAALMSSACATTLVITMQEGWRTESSLRTTTAKGGEVAEIIDDCSESLTYANVTEAMLPCIKRQTIVVAKQDLPYDSRSEHDDLMLMEKPLPAEEILRGDGSEDDLVLSEKARNTPDEASKNLASVHANPLNGGNRQGQTKQKSEQLTQTKDFAGVVTYSSNTNASLFALNTLGTQSKPLNQTLNTATQQDDTSQQSNNRDAENGLTADTGSNADTLPTITSGSVADSPAEERQIDNLVDNNEQREITDNQVLSGNVVNNGIINISPDSLLTHNGTLGGSGVFNGLTLVQDGIIAPGNSPGLITFDDLIWQDIELNIELAGSNQAGVDYDAIQVNGDLQIIGSVDIFIDQTVDFDLEGSRFSILTVNGDILNESGLVVNDPSILAFNIDEGFDLNWLKEAEGWSLTLLASLNPLQASTTVSEPWLLLLLVLTAIWIVTSRRISQGHQPDCHPSH
ncbi:MAG: hypothetical protein GW763_00575 [Paraglaciecola sp.]|nr:hypothetical protein [Paraglaciecola sp.]NCT46487.1 hypothetical protein [Paraglaciecola sp.]